MMLALANFVFLTIVTDILGVSKAFPQGLADSSKELLEALVYLDAVPLPFCRLLFALLSTRNLLLLTFSAIFFIVRFRVALLVQRLAFRFF